MSCFDGTDKPLDVVVLGATGSIGTQTIDVARRHPDKVHIVGIAARSNTEVLFAQARELGIAHVALSDASLAGLGADAAGPQSTVAFGPQALLDLCALPGVDVVVNALVGAAGLEASWRTLRLGDRRLALANKESLVVGGDLLMPLARERDRRLGHPGTLMPIDSEHGAIYQCLIGERPAEVSRLWVTASGGPFRGKTARQLEGVTPEQALAHPTWNMGRKISIDSATLMNKGLEVIEAHHLFDMPYDKIAVVVQPQSAIHSMVEFTDGSVKAHLGVTDMRIPIQYALSYPDRWDAPVPPLDFRTLGTLEFGAPDLETFRCLALAFRAGETGGTLPCVMNAANEVAVAAFLEGRLPFLGIARTVEEVMDAAQVEPVASIEQLLAVDAWARDCALKAVDGFGGLAG